MDYTYEHLPPNALRKKHCGGGMEVKLSEGAVQLAFALHLIERATEPAVVKMFPDGEHAKRFDIPAFLASRGFTKMEAIGATAYGGTYQRGKNKVVVNPKSQHGRGDVVGMIDGVVVRAECKGGIINSTHSGARSKLRSGLSELIGQTMAMAEDGSRHVAVLPATPDTRVQSKRLVDRCHKAGIEFALVDSEGGIEWITPEIDS